MKWHIFNRNGYFLTPSNCVSSYYNALNYKIKKDICKKIQCLFKVGDGAKMSCKDYLSSPSPKKGQAYVKSLHVER